jgi:molybdopterin synthase catalytic subunit
VCGELLFSPPLAVSGARSSVVSGRFIMAASSPDDHVEITPAPLSLDALSRLVASPAAGAIVTFVGTTRDVFQGKPVDRLEYECYAPMAVKKLRELCAMARGRWSLTKLAVAHRTGTVRVGESSVVIAASSAHRADALEATRWMIDELKATVPIWKKEFFEGGEVWKENEEQRREARPPPPPPASTRE